LTLTEKFPFYLIKLNLEHPEDAQEAIAFREQLSQKLNKSRSNGIRVQAIVRENSNVISIRGSDEKELTKLVEELEQLGKHGSRRLITRLYDRPVLCRNFAAHFYRIYFDPSQPQRYLAMLVGFSDEELTADLSETRRVAFRTFLICTVLGCAILLLCLWWFVTRPIKLLTTASESIARGDFDTSLPTGKRDEIGKLSRTFAVMVNEVRARDAEIRRQNEELDAKVRARTASLVEARDLLEVAVKSRDAFLATVSHELRTPLNHIYGYAQLLEISDLDEEQRSDLEKLQGSSRHLLRLVQDILDYQKIIMGRLPVNPVQCNITELLTSIRESNVPKAAERNNQIVLNLNGLEGRMFNDENRFRQILDNLLSNACKFTTNGTITIDARADGEFLDIAVIDTGVGISDSAMDKLFKPFSKVSDSSLNPDGTGLGLVISRELARKMGGDLTVTSVPGQGCTFLTRILRTLPIDGDSDRFGGVSRTETTIAEPEIAKAVSAVLKRRTSNQVLVIDDDANVRELMTRFLSEDGLDVITASSGAEGIEMAARHLPGVITLDIVMPDVDGWSVLAALKANAKTTDIPVVLVTVLDDRQKGYSFGATDYISKPIEGDQLARVVRRYCRAEAPSVLVIDDNVKDREIVRRVLKNDGCVIVEAADGAEGLEKFESGEFDLIILDLMMPVMDGFSFVDEVRKRRRTDMPPIIVLTAMEMTSSNRDRLNGIVADVIQKGEFDRGRFLQEVHRHLQQDSEKA
jgi:signal transduction histidine kinase/DNA-binding response OmpR family regulator